ncbi:MAG: N-acetyltransferase [Oscillospiraceae bacterium]|nr:N-acetyltransferase [Oscillospiraceae bacterium]
MIRIAKPEDVPEILEIYAPYIMTSTATFEYDVPCRKDFLQRFLEITRQYPWLVWEENGEILGYAYASAPFTRAAYSWCAEPSVYLRPEARGRNIAARLYAGLEWILKKQGYQVLYALVTSENRVSLRFHEKNGFVQKGELSDCGYKFGRWVGVVWLEKRINFVENPSSFPVPWLSIVENAEKLNDILDDLSLS